jgi:hypothetical protein
VLAWHVAGVVGPLDPNTYSAEHPGRHAAGRSAGQVLELRRPVDRLEGHWLKALAAVDACGRHPGPVVHGTCILDDPDHPGGDAGLAARLRTAAALLPSILGGAPTQPLEVGRTTRVGTAAQRTAPAVRDDGCAFPDCQRPWPGARPIICGTGWTAAPPTRPTWCCAARIIGRSMRGGWRLARQPDGRLAPTTPPPTTPRRRLSPIEMAGNLPMPPSRVTTWLQEHWALPGTLSPTCCAEPAGWTVVE